MTAHQVQKELIGLAAEISKLKRRVSGRKLAYTVDEFADAIGCSRAQVYRLGKKGIIPLKKLSSGRTVITVVDAEDYISNLKPL